MRVLLFMSGLMAAASPAFADALGEHPAIVARRVIAAQGYDYASKFYPHPAWFHLAAEAPRPMMDHPAVIVARRAEQERLAAREAVLRELAQR